MEHFEESAAGRLLTLAVIVPLATGASLTWDDGGRGSVAIMTAVLVGTFLATMGGGLASLERGRYTLAAILAFPPALLLYFPLVALASHLPSVRVAMGLIALGLVGLLVKGALPRSQPTTAAAPPRRVVQHLA
jgi:hypothetical protein